MKLQNNSKIAIVGGGPAGSFFGYFLLQNAKKAGLDLEVDLYDKKDFLACGPKGCNYCGGIVAESLVQEMAIDGINLPKEVLKEGIESYYLHTDVGSALIKTPLEEKRIASIYRGSGPLDASKRGIKINSFDNYLREKIISEGVNFIPKLVSKIEFENDKPIVYVSDDEYKEYDLVVGATGVNTTILEKIKNLDFGYTPPEITKTKINEIYLGKERVDKYFGTSMHVFLLNIPKLRFAAIIPKDEYVTIALLSSEKIDNKLMHEFLNSKEVKSLFPEDVNLLKPNCQCTPSMYVKEAIKPYGNRIVLIGDTASAKLYKNGIGAAYLTAKTAAEVAVLNGISEKDFEIYYDKICKKLNKDNKVGEFLFKVTEIVQKYDSLKEIMLKKVIMEQKQESSKQLLSDVLWDVFTGSSSYTDIILRAMKPKFITSLVPAIFSKMPQSDTEIRNVKTGDLGKRYKDGEIIVKEGEYGDCMYVIQKGKVKVTKERNNKEVVLSVLEEGESFGEMALLGENIRSANIISVGDSEILTIDKKYFLRKIKEDPLSSVEILEKMLKRIKHLTPLKDGKKLKTKYNKNEIIIDEENLKYMYLIKKGKIKLSFFKEGFEFNHILKERDFIGELSIFGYATSNKFKAVALEDVELIEIQNLKELEKTFQNNPQLALVFMKKIFNRIKENS